jgi:hypothetical protein
VTAMPPVHIVLEVCVTIISVSAEAVRLVQAHKLVRTVVLMAIATRHRLLFVIGGVVIWAIQKRKWVLRHAHVQVLRIRLVMQEMRLWVVMSEDNKGR